MVSKGIRLCVGEDERVISLRDTQLQWFELEIINHTIAFQSYYFDKIMQ